ncbi:MAG TPA: hypothetical protein PK566_03875 [Pseudobacteroides sp.]|nr:hypothetical protein [Pseudobacteroides sp.]
MGKLKILFLVGAVAFVFVFVLTACGKSDDGFSNDDVMNSNEVIEANKKDTPLPSQTPVPTQVETPTPDLTPTPTLTVTPTPDLNSSHVENDDSAISLDVMDEFSNDDVMNSDEVIRANKKDN